MAEAKEKETKQEAEMKQDKDTKPEEDVLSGQDREEETDSLNPEDFIGPDAKYIKLVSKEGDVFVVKREDAMISHTIRTLLSVPCDFENQEIEITLDISSQVLKGICDYLVYRANFTPGISKFHFDPELALDILIAAKFLEC